MTDSGAEPRFSDDRQRWWTGSEWVPASQAPQQKEMAQPEGDGNDWIATSSDGSSNAGNAVRNATSSGLKAASWLAGKVREGVKASREEAAARSARDREAGLASYQRLHARKGAAAAQAAIVHQQAAEQAAIQAAAYQVQFDAWFQVVQRDCPMPLIKSRDPLPGGLQLMNDECLVGTAKHWGFSSDRLALTTHRLIWSHGRLTKDSQQLYLADIRDVRYVKPWMGTGTLTVEAAGLHSMEGLVHMKHAQQFRDSLLSMVHYAKQRPQRVTVQAPAHSATNQSLAAAPAPTAPDRFDQLKKLAELKELGILTDEEFQSEKTKLLSS
jgi:Bacterial PH domain